jgi:hypothetical protein
MFIVNIKKYYTKSSLAILFCMALLNMTHAQGDKKFIRKGNREFEKEKFSESEILYRKAADKNKTSPEAVFNIGDALYKQKKFEDAGKQFIENVNISDDNRKKAAGLYNLGNSMLMADKLQESIEAYKGSLRLFPEFQEAKYNLAYAQDLLKQQQQQQQQQQQNKDQNDKNKEDQNKDQNKDKQDNKEDQQQNKEQDQQQDQQQSVSKEDAQRLLNAIANDEKNIQEKVKQAKAAKERVRTVKNW